MALGTRTKFQLEILIGSGISAIHKIRENILESSRNVSETTPWLWTKHFIASKPVKQSWRIWIGSHYSDILWASWRSKCLVHQQFDYLFISWFRLRSKKASKPLLLAFCGFPSQRASNVESISMLWYYHECHDQNNTQQSTNLMYISWDILWAHRHISMCPSFGDKPLKLGLWPSKCSDITNIK